MLAPESPQRQLVDRVAPLLRDEKPFEAAKLVAEWVRSMGQKAPNPQKLEDAYILLNILLHWLLNNKGMEEAAQLLWGPTQFDPRPESTQLVWKAFDTQNFILLMGAGSMSKSFSMAVRLFLEWIRDPEYTTIKVLGPSEDHLEDNLFTHLVSLHRGSAIPLPGTVGKLFIGLDSRSRKGSIKGVVVPLGKKTAGRLQGVKRFPRKKPHPVFGPLSRMYVFLDEFCNIPQGIHRDIDNVMSNTSGDGLKVIGAFNPTDQNDHVGTLCEPPFGWEGFDADVHYGWTSKRGWFVVRLDAAQCENVKTGRVIFPGLQTREGFNKIIESSGGTNSAGYWAMARGCFPPQGTVMSLIPTGMMVTVKAEFIWYENPTPVGGVDLAFEGGDKCEFASGKWGLATGVKFAPSLAHPNGHTVMFKNDRGKAYPRYALQLDQVFPLEKGDTISVKDQIRSLAQKLKISPNWLAVDKTGSGKGAFDLLRHDFGIGVIGVNYSESCSQTKIMAEDTDTADKLYDRIQTELYFATKAFLEFGYLKFSPSADTEELTPQLTGRLYRARGKQSKVEPKPDYKSRHQGKSPDKADAVTLMVHAARKASGIVPGMLPGNTLGSDSEDDYYDEGADNQRLDITNQFATFDL